MKEKYARISLIISIALLILSGFSMSISGGDVVFFVLAALFAISSIVYGKRMHQYCGMILLIIAVSAALMLKWKDGMRVLISRDKSITGFLVVSYDNSEIEEIISEMEITQTIS